jgi:alpha-galactosidase
MTQISPQINGPRVVGTTPGSPFLFLIPVSGLETQSNSSKAFQIVAKNLPEGLQLDKKTGIITGSLTKDGIYPVQITVSSPDGIANRTLNIMGGHHKLALTPPMGWNSWNIWGKSISDTIIRQTADIMINSGLASHGYQFINLDDGWEGERCVKQRMQSNSNFPEMKKLSEYVHSKGLKLGIYSSPGPKTCAGFEGSYRHESEDAQTFADWGIDYLKYDWCSYESIARKPKIPRPHFFRQDHVFVHFHTSLEELEKPYKVMRTALDACGRDIVYSLVPMTLNDRWNPGNWGKEVGGNLWRTSGDINDNWNSISRIGFAQYKFSAYAEPGSWNDPDMLVVGNVGWGKPRPSKLTHNEQVTHITLWAMLAAPMLIGCDLMTLDKFTLGLLTNDEVIEIDQDPLGQQAKRILKKGKTEIWTRDLWDQTKAVAIFNRSNQIRPTEIKWEELHIESKQPIRDLWHQVDLDEIDNKLELELPPHGCFLLKVGKPEQSDYIMK